MKNKNSKYKIMLQLNFMFQPIYYFILNKFAKKLLNK